MKRFFDLTLSVAGLFFLLPILLLISLFVRLKIGSPIFFRQRRPGLNGKVFNIIKFKTMTDDYDVNGNLLSDEIRLTKFGKLLRRASLDELPELWNVLKGDMSLVGPRPLLEEYLPLYSEKQLRRHEVRPGITGWAQINGRNTISWEEKFEMDVWYVDNQSFLLDLRILWKTLNKVIRFEGVNKDGYATTNHFKGNS